MKDTFLELFCDRISQTMGHLSPSTIWVEMMWEVFYDWSSIGDAQTCEIQQFYLFLFCLEFQ